MSTLPDTPTYTLVIPVRDETFTMSDLDATGKEYLWNLYTANGRSSTVAMGIKSVMVDDGSMVQHPDASLRHPVSKGYGAAIKSGVRWASTSHIVTLDGDGQHHLEDVGRLITMQDAFPQTSMWVGDRRLTTTDGTRSLTRWTLNTLVSGLCGRHIPDLQSGLRIFRRDLAIAYEPILSDGFDYMTGLTLSMLLDGYRVEWIPIHVYPSTRQTSHVRVAQDGWHIFKTAVRLGGALKTRRLRQWLRGHDATSVG